MGTRSLAELADLVIAFRDARDWQQFHNPKDLAISLLLEASEVLELTQWRSVEELRNAWRQDSEALGAELADTLYWLLLIARDANIDLEAAFLRKLEVNERKYPVEQARGRRDKHTTYTKPDATKE